jgi:hypothetical protein
VELWLEGLWGMGFGVFDSNGVRAVSEVLCSREFTGFEEM